MKKKYWKHKKYPGKKFEGNYLVNPFSVKKRRILYLFRTTGNKRFAFKSYQQAKKLGWRLS